MSKQRNGLPNLKKADLEQSFEKPEILTNKAWRTAGTINDIPVSITNQEERYEFEEKDRTRLLFILESAEQGSEDDKLGILLSWRLWDTVVVWHSFVPEGCKPEGISDFCHTLLGGEEFEGALQAILRKIEPQDIYQVCREQERECSLGYLHEALV